MKIISIVGARPQFIKFAPVSRAITDLNKREGREVIRDILVHTGQHYDYEMSEIFFKELEIKEPDYHLGVGSGSHGYQIGEMVKKLEEVLIHEKPDIVMVYGDTNSTLAGALVASKLHINVAHVESGLRSFNRAMPEEINRVITDHISDILFCPTETAVKNLKNEGITKGVYNVGDVMYDSILFNIKIAERKSRILQELGLMNGSTVVDYALATIHRQENTDKPEKLGSIFEALSEIASKHMRVILPLHPRTRKYVGNSLLIDSIDIIKPVSYFDMLVLEKNAKMIFTDSGGVQKEAYFFKVPCTTLREDTEWIETVESGWNVLVGTDKNRIIKAINGFEIENKQKDMLCLGVCKKIIEIIGEL